MLETLVEWEWMVRDPRKIAELVEHYSDLSQVIMSKHQIDRMIWTLLRADREDMLDIISLLRVERRRIFGE